MITYPSGWKSFTSSVDRMMEPMSVKIHAETLITMLIKVIDDIDVMNLSLSGGIDSTLTLALMTEVFGGDLRTYTISCREDHPDVLFARMASYTFGSHHKEVITDPDPLREGEFSGDNAVRQLYDVIKNDVSNCISCDGIDELLCGYYGHLVSGSEKENYDHYLSRLLPDHLVPLDRNSADVDVFLPFLDLNIRKYLLSIPLANKIYDGVRKAIVVEAARMMCVPEEIIARNKYGFCDAFLDADKVAV